MRLRLGLRPGPCWGAYRDPPDPWLVLRGTFCGGEGRREGNGGNWGSLQCSPDLKLHGFKGAASGWKGKGGEGQGGMRKAGEGSWNRAADWLRPALTMVTFNFIRMI